MENTAVHASLVALIQHYSADNKQELIHQLTDVLFDTNLPFLERSKNLDAWIADHPTLEELADVLFDLLMVHFLSEEMHEPEYFDSPAWNEIEDKTLDKGSEMLNVFLYLSDAKDNEVEPHLDDFLTEFLLVGEDEFQDEYRIYESLIVNEDILDADLAGIRDVQKTVKSDTGLQEYFVPLVFFFQYAEGIADKGEWETGLDSFESAILHTLIAFQEN
ncbi:MAG: hypothetical protein LW669_07755 [Sphingobacteriales bacterium]|jgi:hypothetical protein|nr:hypothetical protein [Sphingobacteriales bacterium]